MSIQHNTRTQTRKAQINTSINKEPKYNYLEHSFEKSLQRSYDRRDLSSQRKRFSPPSIQSPLYQNTNLKFCYNSPKDKSQPFHLGPQQRSSHQRSSQFSPYENKEENIRDRLVIHEIKNQNKALTQKITEYQHILDQLQLQLNLKNQELSTLGQLLQKEKLISQQITNQMKQQISVLLSKNTILQKTIINLQRELKEIERSKSVIQSRNRSISATVEHTSKINSIAMSQIKQILYHQNSKNSKQLKHQRDSGKVLNLNHSFNNSRNVSPQNQKSDRNCAVNLKHTGDQNVDSMILQLKDKLGKLHKFEELINSVLEMYHKIMGTKITHSAMNCRSSEMKSIWKWLKTLGHNYNIMNKWKKVLAECVQNKKPFNNNKSCQEEPIEDIFQKIVLLLNHKKY